VKTGIESLAEMNHKQSSHLTIKELIEKERISEPTVVTARVVDRDRFKLSFRTVNQAGFERETG